ncbi:MAG: DUF5115 domain-containing protein [Prevotella sp.]
MIKKIFSALLLATSLVACTDDYTDWSAPQSNPQQDAVSFGNGSVAAVGLIDFANLAEGQTDVQVCNITAPTASDEAYNPVYALTIGDTNIDMDNSGKVKVADLKSYIEGAFGKAPEERTLSAKVSMWEDNNKAAIRLTSGEFQIKAKLDAPFIDTKYYLVGDMTGSGAWGIDDIVAFNHSDANVYDDPVFTIIFESGENKYWKIIPQTNVDAGNIWLDGVVGIAVDGDTSLSGFLTTDNPGAGKIAEAGLYKMTINMMDGTYLIEPLNFGEYFYEIGNESGWSTSHPLYGANFDGKYQGYYYLNGEFKFKPNADNWDGDYEYDGEGKIADNGGSNCPDPGAGFYQIDVDLMAGTYALTKVETISAIGDFNSWGGDIDLTYNTETGAWEASDVALSGGVKFRMNHEWAISWGGNGSGDNFDNLTSNNGANLNVAEGTYDIQLFISYEGNNKVVLTKK